MNPDHPKPLVYIAGPITANPWGCVAEALPTFRRLIADGCVPFAPQFSIAGAIADPGISYEAWLDYDLDVIRKCDGLVRLPGESAGADREVQLATALGLPLCGDHTDPSWSMFITVCHERTEWT